MIEHEGKRWKAKESGGIQREIKGNMIGSLI